VIKGRAGLANRMLAGVTGILYAQLCGRTPVFDWRDPTYSHDGRDAFTHLFDCPAAGSLDELPETDSVGPELWQGRMEKSVRDLEDALGTRAKRPVAELRRRSCIDLTRIDHPEDVIVMWAFFDRVEWLRPNLSGEPATLGKTELVCRLLREHLRPRPEVAERVAAFRREHLDGPSVGVHIRWSDRRSRLPPIERRLARLRREQPDLTVFLATDNSEIHARLAERMDLVATPRWYPQPGKRMHENWTCPDRLENAREALVDMHVLAGCDHLIGDFSSTFATAASLLSDSPVKLRPIPDAVWRRTCRTPLARPVTAYLRRRGAP
jgi:hypothetical protein